jgi:hypothetical protein
MLRSRTRHRGLAPLAFCPGFLRGLVAGFDFLHADRASLRATYEGHFGRNHVEPSAGVKANLKF